MANQLKIHPSAAGKIHALDAVALSDTFYVDRRDSLVYVFRVTLVTEDTAVIDEIQGGLINFLESNDFSMRRKEAHIKTLQALNNDLDTKLKSLDTVKGLLNSSIISRGSGQGVIMGEPLNPITVYQQQMAYYKEKLRINESMALINNIEVIQPFFKGSHYNYPHVNRLLFYFLLAGLAIALVFTPIVGEKRRV